MNQKKYTVTAHTGCMNTPENSIESIIAGINAGADIVEADIRFDKDGIPVLSHDSVKKNGTYATLAEAFDVLVKHPDIKMNLDLKETTNLPEIQRMAKEKEVLPQLFFTGVDDDFVKPVRTECPEIPYYLNFGRKTNMAKFESYIKFLIDKTKDSGAIGINLTKDNCNTKLVERFRKEGLSVSVWTIENTDKDKVFLDMDVDNITCRNLTDVLTYIGKH